MRVCFHCYRVSCYVGDNKCEDAVASDRVHFAVIPVEDLRRWNLEHVSYFEIEAGLDEEDDGRPDDACAGRVGTEPDEMA